MTLTTEQKQKAVQILMHRKEAFKFDDIVFQKKRQKFLDWLTVRCLDNKAEDIKSQWAKNLGLKLWNYHPRIKTLEMYPDETDELKSEIKSYQFFNKWHNTRTKSLSETRLEIDKLPFKKSIVIIIETISNLVNKKFHFAVFYAKGQRSLHVIIYDFDELIDLDPHQRFKAQAFFWRKLMPFGLFQYADPSVWDDEHYLPLEFAPHWKYYTIFDLVLEYLPEEGKDDLD